MFKAVIASAVVFILSLALGIGAAYAQGRQPAAGATVKPNAVEDPPKDLVWKEVPEGEITRILQVLASFTKSNFERISTWTGSYSVHSEEYWSENLVKEAFGARLPKNSTRSLIAERDSAYEFAIQMNPDSCFRSWNTERFRFLTTDARREPVVVPDSQPEDRTSIVTNDNYIYFTPKDPPASYGVSDHPEAQNKRAARRAPVKDAMNKPLSDLMDPRLFYQCTKLCKTWEELNIDIEWINGKLGEENQRLAKEGLRVDTAMHGGKTWYRIRMPIRFPGGEVKFVTSVWSPAAGYNPVLLTWSSKPAGAGWISSLTEWEWRLIDGMYIPSYVHQSNKPKEPSNEGLYVRQVSLKDCSLNKPIPPSKFTATALGLRPGELILDEVDQAVMVVGTDGGVKRLAGFHEPYSPPGAYWMMGRKGWFLVGNGLLAAALLAVWVLWRRGGSRRHPAVGRETP